MPLLWCSFDLASYAQHRLYHAVPLFWRFHKIHHSDLDVDCGTAIRHHPVEILIGRAVDLALIAAIGVPPLAVFLSATLVGTASVFNHGNVVLFSGADRVLRWFVVTPDMHRIHHSANVEESNHNYTMGVSVVGPSIYRGEPLLGHERMALGIADARRPANVTLWQLLTLPLRPVRLPVLADVGLDRPRQSP